MIKHIEFANAPPTVDQCPTLELRLLARSLVDATRKYKQRTKEENAGKEELHLSQKTPTTFSIAKGVDHER